MVKILSSRLLWGMVLIVGGTLLLLDTFGIIKGGALFWTVIAAFVGVLFWVLYLSDHNHWWALIPGTIFLAVSATIGLNAFLPDFSESSLNGAVILGGIALSFLLIYLVERRNWWAIIPAGIMITLAIVSVVAESTTGIETGGVFFLGLGLTFLLVEVLPTPYGQMRWAWIPAGILGLFGIVLLASRQDLINYIWPSALVLAGIFLIIRSFHLTRE
jgi:hypothetical protein